MMMQVHKEIEQVFKVAMYATFVFSWVYFALTAVALVLRRFRAARVPPPEISHYPKVTVQIPTFNELAALNCAKCCMDFDYPQNQLQILIGDDSNRPEISRAIDDFAKKFPRVKVSRRGNNLGFKSGNLNHMLKETTGDYILILDSDFLPGRDFLRRLVVPVVKDPSLAGVQASWHVVNARQNYSTLMGAGIINVIHIVILPLLKLAAKAGVFCGSAELVRKDLLVQHGGWTPGALTEDVDYSLRLMAKGERIVFLDDLTCSCEAPQTPKDLFRQQMRWAYGVMRAFMDHGGRLLISRLARVRTKTAALCFSGGYIMVALLLLTALLGLLNIATGWQAVPAAGGSLADILGSTLMNFLLTCGVLVSTVCAGFATGFGLRSMGKLVLASFTIGFILMFFIGKGLVKAMFGLPMHWFMLKKNGNELQPTPVVAG